MIQVGIAGATGYTGLELIRLLNRHPGAEVLFATSASHAGDNLRQSFPSAPDILLTQPNEAPLKSVDVLFLCLPHAASAPMAMTALEEGTRVIDLSADFRLKDADTYQQWYGLIHPAPELLSEAVYGLTELARDELTNTSLVANPGCYPTSVLLALYPALKADLVPGTVIVDAKSGVSGAGRKPKLLTHFVEVADNLSPYNIGRSHRHLPEMEQFLSWWSDTPPSLIFSPHLIPTPRGLLSTIYLQMNANSNETFLHELYSETYAGEPFIKILDLGEQATFAHVNHTNRCAIGIHLSGDTLILTSAIDNLLKGAAGQAIQNMNVMFGFEETMGLI